MSTFTIHKHGRGSGYVQRKALVNDFLFQVFGNFLFQAAPLDVSCQDIEACGTEKFLYIAVAPRMEIDEEEGHSHERKRDDGTISKDFFRYDPKEDKWTNLDSIRSNGTDDFSLLDASNFL